MFKTVASAAAAVSMILALSGPALAGTFNNNGGYNPTGTILVKATQHTPCFVNSVTDVDFGTQDFESKDFIAKNGRLNISCGDDALVITMSPGGSGSYANQHMTGGKGGTDTLAYHLCLPNNDDTPANVTSFATCQQWGDGAAGDPAALTLADSRSGGYGANENIPVYAAIPSYVDPSEGAYQDTVAFTITVQ